MKLLLACHEVAEQSMGHVPVTCRWQAAAPLAQWQVWQCTE